MRAWWMTDWRWWQRCCNSSVLYLNGPKWTIKQQRDDVRELLGQSESRAEQSRAVELWSNETCEVNNEWCTRWDVSLRHDGLNWVDAWMMDGLTLTVTSSYINSSLPRHVRAPYRHTLQLHTHALLTLSAAQETRPPSFNRDNNFWVM